MIRLGSLAGYPFEGPRALAGWTAPKVAAVYAVMCLNDPENKPQEFSIIYVGHSPDLSAEGFPLKHPRSASWVARSGNKFNLQICWFDIPGGTERHREMIAHELMAVYEPSCNLEKYDQAWKDEWIGEYSNAFTDPLTTGRDPNNRAQ
ncbi:unannotated protein [freshwater metagenome]|jgi:hypothetical protein|uniref:Unannotated protein n=1 Tax=freshwater metagenome TaxID=449393 RepID=A0A6J7SYZ4_9ZZZZ|nr:hypothetical protein [Actinomycetota bacterium]MTB04479.1 hypothetical protein [Actinomycetota bacterium]